MAGTELKQSKDAPLSFFSFQDIIASVTALMVLITLVIALEPLGDEFSLRKRAAAAPMSQEGRVEQARIRLERAQAAIAQARQALQERQATPNVTADLLARMERLVAPERDGVAALEQVASAGDAELRALEDTLLVLQTAQQVGEVARARRSRTPCGDAKFVAAERGVDGVAVAVGEGFHLEQAVDEHAQAALRGHAPRRDVRAVRVSCDGRLHGSS